MNDEREIHSVSLGALKVTCGLLLVLSLAACDTVTRFVARPEPAPATPRVAEEPPAAVDRKPVEKPKPKKSPLYEWSGDGRPVTRILIDTNDQKARFYSGSEEIGWTTVATGVSKYPTPVGEFQVMEKVANKRSNLYGKVYGKGGKVIRASFKVGRDPIPAGGRFEGSKMPYFMRLTYDGVGLHAGPIPRPGRPASHGCIRMPSKIARVVFDHVSHGTPVEIVGKGPSYGNYVAKQQAIAAQHAAEQRRIAERKAREPVASGSAAVPAMPATGSGPTESTSGEPMATQDTPTLAHAAGVTGKGERMTASSAAPGEREGGAQTQASMASPSPASTAERQATESGSIGDLPGNGPSAPLDPAPPAKPVAASASTPDPTQATLEPDRPTSPSPPTAATGSMPPKVDTPPPALATGVPAPTPPESAAPAPQAAVAPTPAPTDSDTSDDTAE